MIHQHVKKIKRKHIREIAIYGVVGLTALFFQDRFSKREFTKFMITSVIGLCINVGGVRILTKVFMLAPEYGVIPTFITPFISFLISKFWAFR